MMGETLGGLHPVIVSRLMSKMDRPSVTLTQRLAKWLVFFSGTGMSLFLFRTRGLVPPTRVGADEKMAGATWRGGLPFRRKKEIKSARDYFSFWRLRRKSPGRLFCFGQ